MRIPLLCSAYIKAGSAGCPYKMGGHSNTVPGGWHFGFSFIVSAVWVGQPSLLESMQTRNFSPPVLLSNRHLQSVLANMPPRLNRVRRAAGPFLAASRELIVDCGAGVRLLARKNPPAGKSNGRLVVMIHGWEGSIDSCYMLSAAPLLAEAGFTVVRLNLRDHGDSHHLNEDLFHSCRLPEVIGAVQSLQAPGRITDSAVSYDAAVRLEHRRQLPHGS